MLELQHNNSRSDVEESFLMLKPDGLRNPSISCDIKKMLKLHDLKIQKEMSVIFTEGLISNIWSEWKPFPLTMALFSEYLEGEMSTTYVVNGLYAVKKCDKIKKIVREKFTAGSFANYLHSPSSELEATQQLLCLGYYTSDDKIQKVDREPRYHQNLFGKLANTPLKHLKMISNKAWCLCSKPLLPYGHLIEEENMFCLCLNDDTVHSLEYVVSCICESIKEATPERALAQALQCDRNGLGVLAIGNKADMQKLYDKLVYYGLDTFIIDWKLYSARYGLHKLYRVKKAEIK